MTAPDGALVVAAAAAGNLRLEVLLRLLFFGRPVVDTTFYKKAAKPMETYVR
jgi:hypothetical protein